MTNNVEIMTGFIKQSNGSYIRIIRINDIQYRLCVESSIWDTHNVSRHTTYWIKRMKNGYTCTFKYGTVDIIDTLHNDTTKCTQCDKVYKSRSGLLRHIKKYHSSTVNVKVEPSNIRTEGPITHITNNTQHISINLPAIRNFNDENHKWLTADVLMEAIRDIPTAIPYLIKEKHFNDKFPENQNVRLENKRSINKRLQVYDGGMWRLKDRPDVECRLIQQVYHILFDFVEMMTEEDYDDDTNDVDIPPIERRIANITRRIRTSELRVSRVRQSLRSWERFRNSLEDDYDKTIEPFKEKMDTFLLDNELKIQQLKERRARLMG